MKEHALAPFSSLDSMLDLQEHLTLLSFQSESDLEQWAVASDQVHHGSSNSELSLVSDQSVRWSGRTSKELSLPAGPKGAMEAHAMRGTMGPLPVKSGWCAMRRNVEGTHWDLNEFEGLRLKVRSDERRYFINIRTGGIFEDCRTDDMYQAVLPMLPTEENRHSLEKETPWAAGELPDEDGWIERRIPWGSFQLTWRGYLQPLNPPMNLASITHFGILIADGQDGEFSLELAEVSAFRYRKDEIHLKHAQHGRFLNSKAGYEHIFD